MQGNKENFGNLPLFKRDATLITLIASKYIYCHIKYPRQKTNSLSNFVLPLIVNGFNNNDEVKMNVLLLYFVGIALWHMQNLFSISIIKVSNRDVQNKTTIC